MIEKKDKTKRKPNKLNSMTNSNEFIYSYERINPRYFINNNVCIFYLNMTNN